MEREDVGLSGTLCDVFSEQQRRLLAASLSSLPPHVFIKL